MATQSQSSSRMDYSRSQKVMMTEPIETTMSIENPSYSNISELQPELLNLSTTNPYQLDFLVCRVCKLFAIAPRQCAVCKALTCNECSKTEGGEICAHCKENGFLQGVLGPPNLLDSDAAELAEKVSFVCPYGCGKRNLKFQEIQMHSLWFCDSKPVETKRQLLGRIYYLQNKIKQQRHEFSQMLESTEKQLMRQIKKMDTEISMLDTENTILKERCDEYERRISMLEGPKARSAQLVRSMEEFRLPILADDIHPENFDEFYWVIPREALFNATDEAIARGLLTTISVGTKANIRSLTSLKLTFNNGRKDYISPTFGRHDTARTEEMAGPVKQITACYFRDSTNFLQFNDDARVAFGAQRADMMQQAKQIEYVLKETQQIVGFYGYKMKNDLDIVWRFSFILNNDF